MVVGYYFAVAVGGAIGSLLRYQVSQICSLTIGNAFPYSILIVNVLGSFIIGLAIAYFEQSTVSAYWRTFVVIGFLGGFTTFSSFSFDTFSLFINGEWLKAGLNTMLNLVFSFIAVAAGYLLFKPL